jgi:hypothetical protein
MPNKWRVTAFMRNGESVTTNGIDSEDVAKSMGWRIAREGIYFQHVSKEAASRDGLFDKAATIYPAHEIEEVVIDEYDPDNKED